MIRRVLKILRKHEENGYFDSDDEHELLSQEQVHSIRSSYAWIVRDDRESICRYAPLCTSIDGFSLHANVAIHNNDREGLERLCRYGLRSSFALSRLRFTDDGNIEYELKRPLPGGSTRMVCTPVEFLRKLAVLIPPPRRNLTRYHGVFAPNHAWRSQIVPATPTEPDTPSDYSNAANENAANDNTVNDPAEDEASSEDISGLIDSIGLAFYFAYLRLMSSNAPSAAGECASWHSLPSQTLPSRFSAIWT